MDVWPKSQAALCACFVVAVMASPNKPRANCGLRPSNSNLHGRALDHCRRAARRPLRLTPRSICLAPSPSAHASFRFTSPCLAAARDGAAPGCPFASASAASSAIGNEPTARRACDLAHHSPSPACAMGVAQWRLWALPS